MKQKLVDAKANNQEVILDLIRLLYQYDTGKPPPDQTDETRLTTIDPSKINESMQLDDTLTRDHTNKFSQVSFSKVIVKRLNNNRSSAPNGISIREMRNGTIGKTRQSTGGIVDLNSLSKEKEAIETENTLDFFLTTLSQCLQMKPK